MNDTKTILHKLSTLDKEQSINFLQNIERVRMDDDEIILALLEESFEEQHERRRMITPSHTAKYLIANGVTVQKHGRWVTANDGTHFCSECGCDAQYAWDDIDRFFINSADDVPDRISDYCPNCGAKMSLEAEK